MLGRYPSTRGATGCFCSFSHVFLFFFCWPALAALAGPRRPTPRPPPFTSICTVVEQDAVCWYCWYVVLRQRLSVGTRERRSCAWVLLVVNGFSPCGFPGAFSLRLRSRAHSDPAPFSPPPPSFFPVSALVKAALSIGPAVAFLVGVNTLLALVAVGFCRIASAATDPWRSSQLLRPCQHVIDRMRLSLECSFQATSCSCTGRCWRPTSWAQA